MTGDDALPGMTFSPTFDRAVAACAHAQVLVTRSAEAATHSREMRLSARHIRQHAVETRDAWRSAELTNALMHRHVTGVARAMRNAGVTREDAAAAVRAYVRFMLYDGGLHEREAECVVDRANAWVEESFQAA